MENKVEDDEINEEKVRTKDVLTEEEILDTLDMTPYEQRIENIIGRQYSNLYFDYFENIYRSKVKNKISSPLADILNKANKKGDSFWMSIYKSIKFYSKENLPILIIKYFNLKAEQEFKYIYNISKKYTNYPNKFINVYIKKMKKRNQKKLKELKDKNYLNENIFNHQSRNNIFIRSFLTKRTIISSRKYSNKNVFLMQKEKENYESISKEEIENKKKLRTNIMKQIHQLKLDTFKEIEKSNKIQIKQRKKYGGVKSRFLDIYKKPLKVLRILNSKSALKINNDLYKNYNFNKYNDKKKENDEYFPYFQKKKSMNNNNKLIYLSKDNIFLKNNKNNFLNENSSKKNLKYYYTTQNSSYKKNSNKNLFRNRVKNNKRLILFGYSKNNSTNTNINNGINFSINKNNNIGNNLFSPFNQYINKTHFIKKSENFSDRVNRHNNGFNKRKINIKLFINKLEQKRNKEILDDLIFLNTNKNEYNNKIYDLFKRTECF